MNTNDALRIGDLVVLHLSPPAIRYLRDLIEIDEWEHAPPGVPTELDALWADA